MRAPSGVEDGYVTIQQGQIWREGSKLLVRPPAGKIAFDRQRQLSHHCLCTAARGIDCRRGADEIPRVVSVAADDDARRVFIVAKPERPFQHAGVGHSDAGGRSCVL